MTRSVEPLTALERAAMVAAVRRLVGAPFRHRGRSETGIDCIGVVRWGIVATGRDVGDYRLYAREPEPDGVRLRAMCREHFGDPLPKKAALQPGDVLLMRWHTVPNHVAVVADYYLGGLALIHALRSANKVVEHRLNGEWLDRVVEAYRP